ncbi:MAG TPA: hypothetical protein VEA44_02625 [Caulobacter sp.]|nr:hypothetical protein [Caulobacter sp.]
MTSNFQHQQPPWQDAFCKSAPEPQHGRKAEKEAAKVKDREPPKRRPAH